MSEKVIKNHIILIEIFVSGNNYSKISLFGMVFDHYEMPRRIIILKNK